MKLILALIVIAPIVVIAGATLWHEFAHEIITTSTGIKFKQESKKSRMEIEREFPMIVELLAILLSANQSPATALMHISERTNGTFAKVLKGVVIEMRQGASFTQSLESLSDRVASPMVRRFTDTLVIAVERGSPLLEVINRQVEEVRQEQKVALMEAAGRAEIGLMIPVVFLILPISVLFALWPSYFSLGRAVGI